MYIKLYVCPILIQVLGAGERVAGLQQPTGIGQRPRPLASEEPPYTSPWKNGNSGRTPVPHDSPELPGDLPASTHPADDRYGGAPEV